MDINDLRKLRGQKIDAAEAIAKKADEEKRVMTDEEHKLFDEHMTEADNLSGEISRLEKLASAKALLQPDTTAQRGCQVDQPGTASARENLESRIFATAHREQLGVFGRLGLSPDDARRAGVRAGMWLRSLVYGDRRAEAWCHDQGLEFRVMTEKDNTAGGVLVPIELERAIIDLRLLYGAARRLCRIVPMGSDTRSVPRVIGNTTAYAATEAPSSDYTTSEMSFDMVNLVAKTFYVFTKMSRELEEDSIISLADAIASDMAWALAKKEDQCWIDGDGSSTYHGMIGVRTKMVDGNHAGSYLDATAGDDQWGEYIRADFHTLMGKLPSYAEPGARWIVHNVGWTGTMQRLMGDGGGNNASDLANLNRGVRTFLGYPVELVEAMPSDATALDAVVTFLFGNPAQACTFGDRRGFTMQVLRELYAVQGKIGILASERIDIVTHDIGGSSAAGPLVGLRGNTS